MIWIRFNEGELWREACVREAIRALLDGADIDLGRLSKGEAHEILHEHRRRQLALHLENERGVLERIDDQRASERWSNFLGRQWERLKW